MVVAQGVDRFHRPVGHRQRRWRSAGRRVAEVVFRHTAPLTVQVHTGRVRYQGEDAVGHRVGLDVLDVVELASFGNDQLAHPVLRIRQPGNGIRRGYLGAHLVEPGLDRRHRGVALGGIDEGPHRRNHFLLFQRLADRRRGVAVVDLNDHIRHPLAGVVIAWAEHGVPHPRAEEDDPDHDDDEHAEGEPADDPAPAPAARFADPLCAAHSTPRRSHRHGLRRDRGPTRQASSPSPCAPTAERR